MDETLDELRREVRRLRDHEEIRQLLYRYARGVDRADLGCLRSVYAEGGIDRHGPYEGTGAEFAQIVVDAAKNVWEHVGAHHITNHYIEVDGDRARAEVYFLAYHPHLDDGRPELAVMSGRYLDELERRDGRWGIVRRTVITDWSRSHVDGPEWERATGRGGYITGRRGRTDRSYELFD